MKELAKVLKAERLRRGLMLRSASERSQISMSLLRALEQGEFERIGSPPIVLGLVVNYCRALGIDEELLGRYGRVSELQEKAPMRLEAPRRPSRWLRPALVRLALGMLLAGIVLGSVWFLGGKGAEQPKPAAPRASAPAEPPAAEEPRSALTGPAETPMPAPRVPSETSPSEPPPDLFPSGREPLDAPPSAALPSETPTPEPSPPVPETKAFPGATVQAPEFHRLEVQTDEKTWMQVIIDGKRAESELLQPGEKREWRAREQMKVVVGNGGGVRMRWNGEPVKISSSPKRVIRLTLPDDLDSQD